MSKEKYYAPHKTKVYALVSEGRGDVTICQDGGGNMHIYINPYVHLGGIEIRRLVPGSVIHIFTESGLHQSKRITEEGQSMSEVIQIMGWSDPPHRRRLGSGPSFQNINSKVNPV
jgi:hypothetical protein